MLPTYSDGDILLVHWFSEVKSELPLATVVVLEREEMPGIFYIKRIQKSHSGLYWVESDNKKEELAQLVNDSRKWGYIPANEVRGKVLFRSKKSSGKKLQR